jgi:hypothetical protein
VRISVPQRYQTRVLSKVRMEIFISRIKIIKLRCLAYFCGGHMMVFYIAK